MRSRRDAKKCWSARGLGLLTHRKVLIEKKNGKNWGKTPEKGEKYMKLKEMLMKLIMILKNFFTLDVRNHKGFTLVELITVIAILAILSSVAVVGYSSYVTKANMQADRTLVEEIKNALILASYSDPGFKGGVVVLSRNEYAKAEGLEDAMVATFGEGWATNDALKLKYDGWSADFQASGFYGDGSGLNDLLDTVDDLTYALGAALEKYPEMMGEGFEKYKNSMGASDSTMAANAAVFYVADNTSELSSEDLQALKRALGSSQNTTTVLNNMAGVTGSKLSATAAMYALAEGYARYYDSLNLPAVEGQKTPSQILAGATDEINRQSTNGSISEALDAFTILHAAFGQMAAVGGTTLEDYYKNGRCDQDLAAYADALKTVSASKDAIINEVSGGLSNENFFTDSAIQTLLSQYADGGIFIYAIVNADGTVTIQDTISQKD